MIGTPKFLPGTGRNYVTYGSYDLGELAGSGSAKTALPVPRRNGL